ncbi:MAG: creatininase family protein [Oscillospiraceae bacterium]|nr:creatininase family protein [Oscillospiraceae bacterium]MBQ9937957.1 creatininase family protein [Oscillospiraceae bacterium]
MYQTSEKLAELRDAAKGVCVIPMGCVEKHGLHLPLGTDIIQASHLAYMASQIENVCVFPDFIFGDIQSKSPSAPLGTVSVSAELELLLLEELCEAISRNGFKKIAIYNAHGGNKALLAHFLRTMYSKKRDYVVCVIDVDLPAPHGMAEKIEKFGKDSIPELNDEDVELILKYHTENMHTDHASFDEAAFILGICPETVHLDRLGIETGKNFGKTKYLSDAGIYIANGGWDVEYPNWFAGDDPVGCNERIGKAAVRIEAERVANAYKVLKEDENLLKWLDEYQQGW